MKKLLTQTILSAILLGTLCSCNKWLDLKPENQQISDHYWENKEEVEAVLGAAYVKLQDAVGEMLIWGEARGNGLALAGNLEADLLSLKLFQVTPSNNLVKWGKFYQIINFSNMVIRYGPTVVEKDPSFSEPIMKSYLSEAYFLRGLAYFYLVRNFRDVPLILEPYMDDKQDFEIAKSGETEVFTQIIKDLEVALEYSKEVWPTVWESKGRSTKWAIYATLADVYLWTEQYDKAIAACDKVIHSGRVGLIEGMVNNQNNWYTIFNPGNSNESIFEIQFDYEKNQGNELMKWFGSESQWLISSYAVSLFNETIEKDIRGAGATYTEEDFKVWKYLGAEAFTGIPRANSDQNWIIYRMADILLMKAEALIMKGSASYGEAIELINRVRHRAGLSQSLSITSTEIEMLNMLLKERGREFLGEGKCWYDLLRIGKRNNYEYKEYLISQVLLSSPAGSSPVLRSKLLNVNSHYLPIYIDEMQANRLLVQNPYYDTLN